MLRAAAISFFIILSGLPAVSNPAFAQAPPSTSYQVPKGMVTLVDVGGEGCAPCRIMKPFLQELEQKYTGKAAIIAINVGSDHNKSKLYGVRVLPTQIFYDREGKEVLRHEGFMDKKSIIETLEKLGVEK